MYLNKAIQMLLRPFGGGGLIHHPLSKAPKRRHRASTATGLPLHYDAPRPPRRGVRHRRGAAYPFPGGCVALLRVHRLAAKHLHSFIQIAVYKKEDGNEHHELLAVSVSRRSSLDIFRTVADPLRHHFRRVDGRPVHGFVVRLSTCYSARVPGKRRGRPNP